MRITLLAALAAVGLIGCVGGIDSQGGPMGGGGGGGGGGSGSDPGNPPGSPPPPPPADLAAAKMLFDQNVYPIIKAKCSSGACHAQDATGATLTRFVATDPANGWSVAVGY